jgi:pimeloyl-ACP methyl ester carboxylesterase
MNDAPLTLRRTTLRGAGLDLAADEAGEAGQTPVVFLHGGGQTRSSWKNAVRQVAARGFHVLSLDLRGHGESGWAEDADYRMDRFVDDLCQVLEDLDQPAFLVGASLGGLASLLAAGERRAPVAGLVLVDVAPRIEFRGASRIGDFMRANPQGFASVAEAADVVAAYLPHRPRPKDTSGLRKNLRLDEDGRYHWHWDPRFVARKVTEIEPLAQGDRLEEAARNLSVPTLLVRGGLSEVVSEQSIAEFRALVPAAEVVNIAGADHMVAGDRNDAFNQAVIDFLVRHRG